MRYGGIYLLERSNQTRREHQQVATGKSSKPYNENAEELLKKALTIGR